jgi:cytoskeleton-associated protein 5
MLLIELEQVEVVLEALLKATLNRIPKLALAATNALLMAVKTFGTPKVVPAGAMLKGLVPLFDAKDAKVRAAAKEITVEMTRWLGSDAVKRDLIDKMRDSMQADVNKAIASVESGARPSRFLRREQAAADAADVGASTSGAGPSDESTTMTNNAAGASTQAAAVPDAYDYAEPVSILPLLDRPGEGENPKFWDGVVSKKWQERQYALQTLTRLASAPKLASADYGNVSKALKQVITKDSNVACIAEAARAAAALARGARKDWTREARALLPGMLDKLKDKTAAVIEALQSALAEYIKYCFELVDVVDDVCVALKHKVPKVQIETLKWLASSFEQISRAELTALHKAILPPIVKCTSASNGDARNAAFAAIASCAKASGGIKTIEFMLMDLDAGKRAKIEEMMMNVESTPATSTLGNAKPASEASSVRSSVDLQASTSFSSARPAVKTEVVSKPVEAPVQAKPVAAPSAPSEAIEASDDGAAARVNALLGEDTVNGLKSANWKERLEAMNSVQEKAASLGNSSTEALDTMVIGLASFPGWSDSNFQVLGAMFKTIATLSACEGFEFRHAASALDVLGEKLADFKLRVPASDSLMIIAEALGPRAVIARIEEKAGAHKNPKVVAEALNWTGAAVLAFGTECLDAKPLISWARQALETPNPVVKGSGAKLIGALHAGIGPAIKDSLDGLKESQLKSLEAEFARNPFEGGIKPSRTVRVRSVTASTPAEPLAVVASSATVPDAPRADIGPKITDSFLGKMADSNWKMRAEALEELGTILKGANNCIAPTVGDLPKSLSARFADSNRMLAVTALNLAGEMACAMGPPIEKVGRATLLDIVKYFGDSKKNVREAAIKACTRWAEAMGFGKVIASLAEKFQELTAKINAEGKKEALDWCAELYSKEENGADDSICTGVLHFAAVGLSDKSTESRKASAALMQAVTTNIDSAKILSLASSLKTDLKSAIEAHLNKGKASTSFRTAGTAVMAANAMKTASTAAQRNAARKAATLGGSTKSTENAVAVPTGPVFLVDTDKAVRIRKYPRKAVKFETLRDEDLMLAYRELKSASQGHFRADIQKMMFADDIKAHLAALDAIHEAIKSDESELINNFDLLIRWLMLRISEASPNTQVLNKVLDVVLDALHAASDLDYKLAEQEAAILLPVIVERSGHNIEAIREKFRSISRAVPTVYLASKFVGYLTTGIVETKSSRTRSECLEEISRLIERHGLLVCLREDKTLQEVIKLVDTRDISLRNGALKLPRFGLQGCLVRAFGNASVICRQSSSRMSSLINSPASLEK